jgi:hypothetical protein
MADTRIKTNDLDLTTDIATVVVNDSAGETKKAVLPAGVNYNTYVALIDQTGVANPVMTVLENTLGFTPTPLYFDTGYIYLEPPVGFTWDVDKTYIAVDTLSPELGNEITNITGYVYATDSLDIYKKDFDGTDVTPHAGGFSKSFDRIEIRVYE